MREEGGLGCRLPFLGHESSAAALIPHRPEIVPSGEEFPSTLLHPSYDEQILLARDEGNFDQKVWRAEILGYTDSACEHITYHIVGL